MAADLPIRCACGTLRGVARGVSGSTGNRVVCYCDDCQLFGFFLGRVEEIFDARGGTDVFQMSPAALQISEGAEKLACMRLTATGIVRWYAGCCRTPIGNTLATPQLPLLGLIHSCIDRAADGRPLDVTLGPVRYRIYGRYAKGREEGPPVSDGGSLASMFRFGTLMLKWRWRGDHRRSPFFDAATSQPTATPHVLSADELNAVRAARTKWLNHSAV